MKIDARGKPCPLPVLLAKQALDQGADTVNILVDEEIAVENLTRLGESSGCTLCVQSDSEGFLVTLSRGATQALPAPPSVPVGKNVYLIPGDTLGQGDNALGQTLLEMALFTLSADKDILPASVIFINGGVPFLCNNPSAAAAVQELEAAGVAVLVCGTCLKHYGLEEKLPVGKISNMYEILGGMEKADKVITL